MSMYQRSKKAKKAHRKARKNGKKDPGRASVKAYTSGHKWSRQRAKNVGNL